MGANYKKLRSGEWGLYTDEDVQPGDTIQVTMKAGTVKTEIVGQIIWQGDGKTIASIRREPKPQEPPPPDDAPFGDDMPF